MTEDLRQLAQELEHAMRGDQHRLRQRLTVLKKSSGAGAVREAKLLQLQQDIGASVQRRLQREQRLPTVSFPEELPVSQRQAEIAEAIRQNQVVIVAGETGSGKTTQLPKICLGIGRGVSGLIGHTQPRRIAARSVAARIASELGTPLGATVGYKVRFVDHTHPDAYIKLMTDGILLAELQSDRFLEQYDTLIIDEAHERSLNIDFLLGYLHKLLPRRPDLKLIITSATIDTERFSRHFGDAPVIEVSGRTYPVEIRYHPTQADDGEGTDVRSGVLAAMDALAQTRMPGDTLVFLSGESEIREVAEALRKHHPPHTEILPLYSRLSASEQDRVFQPGNRRRIILATNVAETSLTVPGIRYVIDAGLARISRYSYHSKVQRLPIEKISRSSADQRAGRCGRVTEGVCIRLYTEDDYLARPQFTPPEIQRTNLASVILQMRLLGLGNPEEFPFIDAPDRRYVNDGFRLLRELGAMDDHRQLTSLGRDLARLPLDPRLGRMILAAKDFACLAEVLVIVSALSIQDPRERPADKQKKADERHAAFKDEDSDFLGLLKLWRDYEDRQKHLSNSQLKKFCRDNFLSYMRMREWRETHQQLHAQVNDMGLRLNQTAAGYAEIHRALLTGLLGNIGIRDDTEEKSRPGKKSVRHARYLGGRDTVFSLFPGSVLAKKRPRWIMAAELVETSRLYALMNARIEPEWIEPAAHHLVKRSYTEPFWDERQGQVCAHETVTLNGLVLCARRRVYYGAINPEQSREMFIREALVNGRLNTRAGFHAHNRALIEEAYALEDKSRRRDIFTQDDRLYAFFDRILPAHIHSGPAFERWRVSAEAEHPRLLHLTREVVISGEGCVTPGDYPGEIRVNEVTIPLKYSFDPGGEQDGVTAMIPLGAINQLVDERFEWLVPGFLLEKITAVLKGLPKVLRKQLVPVPDKAAEILRILLDSRDAGDKGLMGRISGVLKHHYGIDITAQALREIELPAHLRMRFCVVDRDNKVLSCGRDLAPLRARWAAADQLAAEVPVEAAAWPTSGLKSWSIGALPGSLEIQRGGARFRVFPALVDRGDTVGIQLCDSSAGAEQAHLAGLIRLAKLELNREIKALRRNLPHIDAICLLYATVGPCDELTEELLSQAIGACLFSARPLPRDGGGFRAALEQRRGGLVTAANDLAQLLHRILSLYQPLHQHPLLKRMDFPAESREDIQQQLNVLVYRGFLRQTAQTWLAQLPRFLQGIHLRLEKLATNMLGDKEKFLRLQPYLTRYQVLLREQNIDHAQLQNLRWMLEEYRVSLFAQTLKTSIPVSAQRLERQILACTPRDV